MNPESDKVVSELSSCRIRAEPDESGSDPDCQPAAKSSTQNSSNTFYFVLFLL